MSSGHYGYWCATCNTPIKDGEQVIDVPNGVAHAACYYGDPCPACDVPMHAGCSATRSSPPAAGCATPES